MKGIFRLLILCLTLVFPVHAQAIYMEAPATSWVKGANNGEMMAQYQLSSCFAKGEGVQQDWAMAIYWLKLSGSSGKA